MLGHPQRIVTMVQLYYLLRGIRRVQGNLYHLPQRAPITVTDLHILRSHLLRSNLPHHDQLLLCSAVTLAFAGLLRSAGFVSSSATAYDPGARCCCQTYHLHLIGPCYVSTLNRQKLIPLKLAVLSVSGLPVGLSAQFNPYWPSCRFVDVCRGHCLSFGTVATSPGVT